MKFCSRDQIEKHSAYEGISVYIKLKILYALFKIIRSIDNEYDLETGVDTLTMHNAVTRVIAR